MTPARWAGLAVAVAVAVLAAGCGASTARQPAPSGIRTVVDMTGRQVQIPATVTRVATNVPLIPATIDLLGGIDNLVAAATASFNALFTTIAPSTKDIPVSPVNSLNSEELLTLHPQVFIMTNLTPGLLPMLERLKIPVVQITEFATAADLENSVTLVAEVLGGEAPSRAQQYRSYFNATIQRVQAKTASLPDAGRPTVYYAPGPNPTTTVGAGNIITASIEAAGGRNIAAEHGIGPNEAGAFAFPTVTAETLLTWDPEVIIAINADGVRQFEADPKFAPLNAVRNHRVYACPVGIFPWCASSSEAALAPLFLAKAVHPDLFGDLTLGTEVTDFYTRFYGYALSEQQAAKILSGVG
ncbi:ABC transporter substrate-binding protein [Mycobacterium sp. pUA109]|uniref:ABC transporter substrate-binding protein n=1 Tax=Mycobacterium sp. pUA109 TaxID=3238982 RepID=UPI00351B8F78